MWVTVPMWNLPRKRGLGDPGAVDIQVEKARGTVDQRVMLWVRVSTVFLNFGSSCRSVWTFSTA